MALYFAEQTKGVIVNADSAQIYRDVPILSSAPTVEDRSRVDHRLYGIQDGALACSAAHWAELARREVADIHTAGKLPILVGGTGLYLRTLLDGIAPVPAIDPEVRQTVREMPMPDARERLRVLDAEAAARLNPADRTRIARALEVVLSTGRTLSEWQHQRTGGIAQAVDLRPLILLPPRDWLYARCDKRFAQMMEWGAIPEVEHLLSRNLNPRLPVMRAIGVPEITAFIRGEMSREDALAAGQQATRRYAKRQDTWFAHQPPDDWPRFTSPVTGKAELVEALSFLQRQDGKSVLRQAQEFGR